MNDMTIAIIGLVCLMIGSGLMYNGNEFLGIIIRRGFTTFLYMVGVATYIYIAYTYILF